MTGFLMEFKNESAWKVYQEKNRDTPGLEIMAFMERWTDMMENKIANTGATVKEAAESTRYKANHEDVSLHAFNYAVMVLGCTWIHGKELEEWNARSESKTE